MEHSYKLNLQQALDLAVNTGEYNEDLGKHILDLAEVAIKKLGLLYRYSAFEVDYILRPRIVDDMLIKTFKYKKESSTAYTYMTMAASQGATNGILQIRKEKRAEYDDVYYYSSMMDKIKEDDDDDSHLWELDVIYELLKQKE